MDNIDKTTDIIIIGAGHAGCEAALAAAKLGKKVLLLSISLDNIALLACNPSIGGTAKGHLVREIDALGGEMGLAADSTVLQLKMLNSGKGAAVRSLRAQTDKHRYHTDMKSRLERHDNIRILGSEAVEILHSGGQVSGICTNYGEYYYAGAIIVASGVYLSSRIITGSYSKKSGPGGFAAAECLSGSLSEMGFALRRFKTGTPARADAKSLDYSKMERQDGDSLILPFSLMSDFVPSNTMPCYLTYTNAQTHEIIRENIHLSPMYSGEIKGTGARYCPSIEDKVVRFSDKDRHQIFIEPEGASTTEVYLQGLSTSLPVDVQKKVYKSVAGLENIRITRYAYAIEYDCIDSTELTTALHSKRIKGLFFAGQINGSSGYEEAAAQGLVAGINAARYLSGMPPFILSRYDSYIGVLVDDLVMKGTNEPYRMMTARAENRLGLRQDNTEMRLTEIGRGIGLVDDVRYNRYLLFRAECDRIKTLLSESYSPPKISEFLQSIGQNQTSSPSSLYELIKRPEIKLDDVLRFFNPGADDGGVLFRRASEYMQAEIKYGGYLIKQGQELQRIKKMEQSLLPADIDYMQLSGIRIEARQKLQKLKPSTIAEASRISGVSPADIAVLLLYLTSGKIKQGGNDN